MTFGSQLWSSAAIRLLRSPDQLRNTFTRIGGLDSLERMFVQVGLHERADRNDADPFRARRVDRGLGQRVAEMAPAQRLGDFRMKQRQRLRPALVEQEG